MPPLMIRLGFLTVSIYGVLLGLSLLLGIYLFIRQAQRAGFSEEKSLDFILVTLTAALLTARAVNYFQYPSGGWWFGGLSFSGGVLGFLLIAYFYLRKQRWSILKTGDCLLPAVLLTFGLGDLGYFIGVTANIKDVIFTLLYLAFSWLAFRLSQKQSRTGLTFYSGASVLFLVTFIYRLVGGGIREWGTLISLALTIYFVVGLKRRGYLMELYPQEFIASIKVRLDRYLKHIEQQEKQLTSEDSSFEAGEANRSADAEDEASDDVSHDLVRTTLGSLGEIKGQINKALGRIRSGEYGKCERCGTTIDKARLEAFPEATLCVSCEQRREESATRE